MFGCTFMLAFQYVLIPIFGAADVRDYDGAFYDNLFYNGLYSDFNSSWFQEIGTIVCFNLMYNAVWPIIEFSYTWFFHYAFKSID